MEKLLEEVARATRLREGAEGVAQVLRTIYASDRIKLGDISREVGVPVPVVAAVRRELERVCLLERDKGLALTSRKQCPVRASSIGFISIPPPMIACRSWPSS